MRHRDEELGSDQGACGDSGAASWCLVRARGDLWSVQTAIGGGARKLVKITRIPDHEQSFQNRIRTFFYRRDRHYAGHNFGLL